jgi:hypothetical protein
MSSQNSKLSLIDAGKINPHLDGIFFEIRKSELRKFSHTFRSSDGNPDMDLIKVTYKENLKELMLLDKKIVVFCFKHSQSEVKEIREQCIKFCVAKMLLFKKADAIRGHWCDGCGKEATCALQVCSGCCDGSAKYRYCNAECQKKLWNIFHKGFCGQVVQNFKQYSDEVYVHKCI